MIPTATEERRSDLKSNLLERLHNPLQLRIFLLVVVLAAGYFAVYVPLSGKIVETTKKLERDRKMLELAGSIEQLQKQFLKFESRVPQQADSKEWVEYVMEGIRQLPVNLLSLNCKTSRRQSGPTRPSCCKSSCKARFSNWTRFFAGWSRTGGCCGPTR